MGRRLRKEVKDIKTIVPKPVLIGAEEKFPRASLAPDLDLDDNLISDYRSSLFTHKGSSQIPVACPNA